MKAFLDELRESPSGAFQDQVDAALGPLGGREQEAATTMMRPVKSRWNSNQTSALLQFESWRIR